MAFEIEIIEGHDPSSYFWFRPVIVHNTEKVTWKATEELKEEFSVEEGDVDCFLSYFLFKYFDSELVYNKNRFESGYFFSGGFEWYLTHNYFTYDTLREMLSEMSRVSDLLDRNFDDPSLDRVKERYSIYYLCPQDSEDWITGNNAAIQKYSHLITDFYKRFISRLTKMMDNNTSTNLISIMGP